MIKKADYFNYGLLSFLLAHIAYLIAIIQSSGFEFNILMIVPSVVLLIFLSRIILPKTGNKKIFVLIYSSIIVVLLWQAWARVLVFPNFSSIIFALGIFLFVISDTLLAYNRFVNKIRFAQFYILPSYYTAQLLISLSI